MSVLPLFLLSCQDYISVPKGSIYGSPIVEETEDEDASFDVHLSHEENDLVPLEQDILMRINDYREGLALGYLNEDPCLIDLAREHSKHMALGEIPLGHDGFDDRVGVFLEDYQYQTYQAAENVGFASGNRAPEITVEMWLNSEGHRENIEGPYALTGVGAFEHNNEIYFTQIFFSLD